MTATNALLAVSAVAHGSVAAAECLLDFKASVRPSKVGNPALLRAALGIKDVRAKYDMLELLLGAGASVVADVMLEGGRTMLVRHRRGRQ